MKKKMIIVKNKKGNDVRLLRPDEKAQKYALEMKEKVHYNNMGKIKTNKQGEARRLTDIQRAWRSGYLAARQDNADVYNAKNNPAKLKENKAKRRQRRMAARKAA